MGEGSVGRGFGGDFGAGIGPGGVLPAGLLVGQALIWDGTAWTSGNSATANDFVAMDGFTTGSWYAGTATPNAEQPGSMVAVATGTSIRRGHISYQFSADVLGGRFVGLKARGTQAAPAAVQNGDQVALLVGGGWDGADFSGSSRVAIEVDGAVAAGVVPMRVAFYTGTGVAPTLRGSVSSAGVWNLQGLNAGVLSVGATGDVSGRAPTDQLEWAALDTGNTNLTRYLRILNNVNSVLAAPGAGGRRTMARGGYIIGMAARFDGGALAAANVTWNVEINGGASAASLTVNATNQQGVVTGLAVPFNALDVFAVTELCSAADATTSRPVVEVFVAYV